jgi:hypothetical protein
MILISLYRNSSFSVRYFDNRLIDVAAKGKIQVRWRFYLGNSGIRILEALQIGEECLPYIPAQGEPGELAFALNADEASGLQFFDVVRDGCRGDWQVFAHIDAGNASITRAQPLNHLHAPWIAQSLQDR